MVYDRVVNCSKSKMKACVGKSGLERGDSGSSSGCALIGWMYIPDEMF